MMRSRPRPSPSESTHSIITPPSKHTNTHTHTHPCSSGTPPFHLLAPLQTSAAPLPTQRVRTYGASPPPSAFQTRRRLRARCARAGQGAPRGKKTCVLALSLPLQHPTQQLARFVRTVAFTHERTRGTYGGQWQQGGKGGVVENRQRPRGASEVFAVCVHRVVTEREAAGIGSQRECALGSGGRGPRIGGWSPAGVLFKRTGQDDR